MPTFRNWAGNVRSDYAEIVRPTHVDALADIVRTTAERGGRVPDTRSAELLFADRIEKLRQVLTHLNQANLGTCIELELLHIQRGQLSKLARHRCGNFR